MTVNNKRASNNRFSSLDYHYMSLAIQLAAKGMHSTTPNPRVGCVLVKDEQIIGRGFHAKAGEPHAEINALSDVKTTFSDLSNPTSESALITATTGATAYVTLEPCSHYGRTGPCALALANAKVARVVIANLDPNPLVAGKGVELLKQAGILVDYGCLDANARQLNAGFFKRMSYTQPFVTVKLAASLDGKTALSNGESKWITGSQARRDVQRHRASSCAIMTGAGTALYDNPRLNVRADELSKTDRAYFEYRGKQPLRVILESRKPLTNSNLTLFNDGQPTVVFNTKYNPCLNMLSSVSQIQVDESACGRVNLRQVLEILATKFEVNYVWVEAGATLSGALVQDGLVDELILYQAPKFLGSKGKSLLTLPEYTELQEAINAPISSVCRIGNDVKYTLKLKA